MAAKINIRPGARLTFGKDGYRSVRTAIVSGVTGDIALVLFNAINDGDLPNYGDADPAIPTITLNNIVCSPAGGDKYLVTMTYFADTALATTTATARLTVSATSITEEVKFNVNGDRMQTSYTTSTGIVTDEPFTAKVERSRITYNYEYTASAVPRADIDLYEDHINSVIWNGYAVGTVLCGPINVVQRGNEYQVKYSLLINPDTWVFKARTKSQPSAVHPTEPDASLNLTTGERLFDVYPSVDFTPLGFTI